MEIYSRNSIEGLLQRTIRNLEWMREQKTNRAPIHLGTQLCLSMLGLFVFPDADKELKAHLETFVLKDLFAAGWREWEVSLDEAKPKTTNLGVLVWHVRNAISHGHMRFSSESLALDKIEFRFGDKPNKKSQIIGRLKSAAWPCSNFVRNWRT